MKTVSIYQTLEDRGNYKEVEKHGPYLCSDKNSHGEYKSGVKEPWLGEGYYFWDSFIDDAHWWGKSVYRKFDKSYIICETVYDQHSPLLFDTVADPRLLLDVLECAKIIRNKWNLNNVSVPLAIGYLRKMPDFKYKAIRVYPNPVGIHTRTKIFFPGNKFVLTKMEKIQVCFFDKTLLTEPFEIVYPPRIPEEFTI